MATNLTTAPVLGDVPEHQRHRILSGMRWTVWLSAIAVPFSVAVNLLLARVGPETLGVYGLLSVYVTLTSAFLYFGGDTVVMRYIPECRPEERASFLVSYLAVIFAVMSGWLVSHGSAQQLCVSYLAKVTVTDSIFCSSVCP